MALLAKNVSYRAGGLARTYPPLGISTRFGHSKNHAKSNLEYLELYPEYQDSSARITRVGSAPTGVPRTLTISFEGIEISILSLNSESGPVYLITFARSS